MWEHLYPFNNYPAGDFLNSMCRFYMWPTIVPVKLVNKRPIATVSFDIQSGKN